MRLPICAAAIACLMLLTVAPATTTAQHLPIQTRTTADGLSSNRVLRVVRDRRGFLWFCTASGVSRFDGQRITTYDPDNGLPFTTINDLLITRAGAYLLASNGIGIIRLDVSSPQTAAGAASVSREGGQGAEAWRFRSHRVSREGPSNRVNVLMEDRQGQIWAGTDGGLYMASTWQEPPTFVRVPVFEPARDWSVQIWALVEDAERGLWIGSTAGLVRRTPSGRMVPYRWRHLDTPRASADPADRRHAEPNVWALALDRLGHLWAGHSAGLSVIAPEPAAALAASHTTTVMLPAAEGQGHSDGSDVALPARPGEARTWSFGCPFVPIPVMALDVGRDGHLWILGRDRLTEFDGRSFRSHPVPMLLAVNDVAGVVEDADGHVWTGSVGHGAVRFLRSGFMAFSNVYGAVFEVEDGRQCVYRGSVLAGCFDGHAFVAAPVPRPQTAMPVPSVRALLRDRTGAWWMGGQRGLYRFPPGRRFFDLARERPMHVYTQRDGLATDDVFSLFEDSRGDIWIGTFRAHKQVLSRWERAADRLRHYSDADGLPSFSSASSFAEDRSGAVWILFREGHVARYRDGRFTVFRQESEGLPVASGSIYVDRRGRLWLGAGGGLLRVDRPETGRLEGRRYTTAQGLATNIVNTVTEDRWGALYLGTSRGVDRLDPDTDRIWHYAEADGLAGSEVRSALCDRYGALWFSGSGGVSRFVRRPEPPSRPPDIAIGAAAIADRAVPLSALGDTTVDLGALPGALRLRIDYFGSTFGVGPLRYRYKLEGVDDEWSAATTQQSVRFERLAPRRYQFLVQAINQQGTASVRAASVTFRVLPPIWQRWWVLLTMVALTALAIRWGVRRRITRLVQLERLRTRLASDLHDEIGSNLSQIAVLSEVLRCRSDSDGPDVPDHLARIADVSRESVAAMSDIVWAIDPQRDSVADLTHRMRRFANDVLTARDITVRFSADAAQQAAVLDAEVRRDVFLVFKEAVHNVARHAGATEADIALRVQRHELSLLVRDNGKGLETSAGHDGLGLRSMRARATRIGGRLDLESSNGGGARVLLTVPLTRTRATKGSRAPVSGV